MFYKVTKTFKTTCGDVIKKDTILDEFSNIGDYTKFAIDEPFTGEIVYLNNNEIEKFLEEYYPSYNGDGAIDWDFL